LQTIRLQIIENFKWRFFKKKDINKSKFSRIAKPQLIQENITKAKKKTATSIKILPKTEERPNILIIPQIIKDGKSNENIFHRNLLFEMIGMAHNKKKKSSHPIIRRKHLIRL
jgi:hypothetical protein